MSTRGRSYCDHRLMKGRRGREVDCLAAVAAAAEYRLAYGGVGGGPFRCGYVQWQAGQLVKQKDKAGRIFYPRCRWCTGVRRK